MTIVVVITKFTPVMLLFCSINMQSFVYDKSSLILQFINGKSRDLQTLLKYSIGIGTSTFKVGAGGQFASPSFPGLSGVFYSVVL